MIGNKWDIILHDEFFKDYFKELFLFVSNQYKYNVCFPKYDDIFNALKYTDYDDVRVVILGQDPYHGEGEAHGFSFSVLDGVKRPPSLVNIFKELESDVGYNRVSNNLSCWASQGVLLLNSILTVEKDKPLSHSGKGWEIFTDFIISKLNERDKPIVFILWGGYARSKKKLITNKNHYIIESVHPSPLSCYRGFFGSKPFSRTNEFLIKNGLSKIDW